MRVHIFLVGVFLSSTLYGNELKPCQIVGFDDVAEVAIPIPGTDASVGISSQVREEEKILLRNCIKKYAVCIVEAPPGGLSWLNEKLIEPNN
ncbi:MAG TPA: hypothetical protein DDY37_01375, partial [Legionella sp.]|nr:hypothetical protein [Legionella sp.]